MKLLQQFLQEDYVRRQRYALERTREKEAKVRVEAD
jgi:hypothetical protein